MIGLGNEERGGSLGKRDGDKCRTKREVGKITIEMPEKAINYLAKNPIIYAIPSIIYAEYKTYSFNELFLPGLLVFPLFYPDLPSLTLSGLKLISEVCISKSCHKISI